MAGEVARTRTRAARNPAENGLDKSSVTPHDARRAEPSHPIDLTRLGADHPSHPASVHPPRGSPATARAATGSKTDSDGHTPEASSRRSMARTPQVRAI